MRHLMLAAAATLACAAPALSENRIDLIRPDAPELAARGPHPVGVRAASFTDPDRIDVIATTATGTPPPRNAPCRQRSGIPRPTAPNPAPPMTRSCATGSRPPP